MSNVRSSRAMVSGTWCSVYMAAYVADLGVGAGVRVGLCAWNEHGIVSKRRRSTSLRIA